MADKDIAKRMSVKGGYCAYPDLVECALERTDCDDPVNFMSVRQMQGAPVNAHGGSCRWQSAVTSHLLGRCVDEVGLPTDCSPNLDSCPAWDNSHESKGWVPNESSAAPPRDWVSPAVECPVEDTTFGRCDYGMCAWSHEQCTEDNTWEAFSEGCTCDKVQVGACTYTDRDGNKDVQCAVSALGCDDEQTWVVAQEVKTAAGFECYLCREESPAQTVPPAQVVTPPLEDITDMNSDLLSRNSGQGKTEMSVILIVVIGSVLAISIIGLVGYKALSKRREMRERARQKALENRPPPAKSIEIAQIGIAKGHKNLDSEWGQSTDMDNASVLSEDSEHSNDKKEIN